VSMIAIDEVRTWATEAGALARSYFNRVPATRKADYSPVTQADLEVEQLLLRSRGAAQLMRSLSGASIPSMVRLPLLLDCQPGVSRLVYCATASPTSV